MSERKRNEPQDALEELLRETRQSDAEALNRAAAAVLLAVTPISDAMPAHLRDRIVARATLTRPK